MYERILDGICRRLNDAFGGEYEIYTEQVKQGLSKPCFLVSRGDQTLKPLMGDRRRLVDSFLIRYIPREGENWKDECFGVRDLLFLALEFIEIGGEAGGEPLRGINARGKIEDGSLLFSVDYEAFVRVGRKDEDDANDEMMEEIQVAI